MPGRGNDPRAEEYRKKLQLKLKAQSKSPEAEGAKIPRPSEDQKLIDISTFIAEPQEIVGMLQRKVLEYAVSRNTPSLERSSSSAAAAAREDLPNNHIKHLQITKRIKKITGALKKIDDIKKIDESNASPTRNQEEQLLYKELLDIAFDCRASIYEEKEPFFIHIKAVRSSRDSGWPLDIDKMYQNFSNFLAPVKVGEGLLPDPYLQVKVAEGLILLKPKYYLGYLRKIADTISNQEYESVPQLL